MDSEESQGAEKYIEELVGDYRREVDENEERNVFDSRYLSALSFIGSSLNIASLGQENEERDKKK